MPTRQTILDLSIGPVILLEYDAKNTGIRQKFCSRRSSDCAANDGCYVFGFGCCRTTHQKTRLLHSISVVRVIRGWLLTLFTDVELKQQHRVCASYFEPIILGNLQRVKPFGS